MSERPVHEQIGELSDSLVLLATSIRNNLLLALDALNAMDSRLIGRVRNTDREIDDKRAQLESNCLSFLALQQPVARDLRTIVAIMKINDDLERIGDLTVHIVERIQEIGNGEQDAQGFALMGSKVSEMLQYAIEAFSSKNTSQTDLVNDIEEEIDCMHRTIVRNSMNAMKQPGRDVDRQIAVLSISRYLERIADHITKIAREVVYLATGEAPRQNPNSYDKLLDSLRN